METNEIIEEIYVLLEGKATREQEKRIGEWIRESEQNRKIYQQVAQLYYQVRYANEWEEVNAEKALRKVQGKLFRWRQPGSIYRIVAVAALLVVCIGTVLLLRNKETKIPVSLASVEDVESGEMKATLTLATGEKVTLGKEGNARVDLGFADVVEDSLKGLVYQFKDSVRHSREFHALTVPRAGEYIMMLSDGSRVWLNSETELKYPVIFDKNIREVYLTGEAYFEVAKDAGRPFVVVTPQTRTTVLGTSFNVMAYRGETFTEITLVTGAVTVAAGERECKIVPGQQVAVDNESLEMKRKAVNPAFFASWKDGLFDFDHMTLSELCVKLSRWYDIDFFFVNQAAAEKRFTGAIKRNRSLQFMFDFIQKTSGVRFEMKGKTVMVYNN